MDKKRAGSTNVSVVFAVKNIFAITAFRATYSRWSEGGAASAFQTPVSNDLTALALLTDAHADNKGIFMSVVATDGSKFQVRVDFPDAAFATGADRVVCALYDDADEEVAHRIFKLDPEPVDGYFGKVWLDTNGGTAGTVKDKNGTANNPVDNVADALTLLLALDLTELNVAAASAIVLAATLNIPLITGENYSIDLNDKQVDTVTIIGADITGTATSSTNNTVLKDCLLDGAGLASGTRTIDCRLKGVIGLSGTGANYTFTNPRSVADGAGSPAALLFNGTGGIEVIMTGAEGYIEVQSFDGTSGDTMLLTGKGIFKEGAGCVDGSPFVLGVWQLEAISVLTPVINIDNEYTVSEFVGTAATIVNGIKAKTDKLPHSLKKNTAINRYYFMMFDETTGDPKTLLTVTGTVIFEDDASFAAIAGPFEEVGFGLYRSGISAANTNGDTGAWRFVAAGAKDTVITFITEEV